MTIISDKPQIVVADDSKVIRLTLKRYLSHEYLVHQCEDGEVALQTLQENPDVKLLITDLGMPNMDGYELIEAVRNHDEVKIAEIPIIVITGAEDTEAAKEKVVNLGATDLIGKPFDRTEVLSRLSSYINYREQVHKLEQTVPVDSLTGLATSDYFVQQGEKTFSMSMRHGYEITVVRMRMAGYDNLCDKYTKNVADKIVKQVAGLIGKTLRTEDLAAYFGNGEFALLLHFSDHEDAEIVHQRIYKEVDQLRMRIGQDVVTLLFYTGIVSETQETTFGNFMELFEGAEIALQKALESDAEKAVAYPEQVKKPKEQTEEIEVSIDELLQRLTKDPKSISRKELICAMRKFLPLIEQANLVIKLGLGKMIPYLKRKLK